MSAPKLRPFISYYGGKWRAAPRYPEPQHDTIIEPFAGSAGYSVRYPDRDVILVDAYEPVAAVWAYLIGASEQEILELPDVPHDGTVDDLPGLTQEQRWLIGWWINKATTSPCKSLSSGVKSVMGMEGYDGSYWSAKVRQRIASQLQHIRHWRVIHGDYADAPDIEATWFVDPPYQEMGRRYPHSADMLDFKELGVWCQMRQGQVIACENDGADWLPFEPMFSSRSMTGRVHSHRTEAIWTSEGAA